MCGYFNLFYFKLQIQILDTAGLLGQLRWGKNVIRKLDVRLSYGNFIIFLQLATLSQEMKRQVQNIKRPNWPTLTCVRNGFQCGT